MLWRADRDRVAIRGPVNNASAGRTTARPHYNKITSARRDVRIGRNTEINCNRSRETLTCADLGEGAKLLGSWHGQWRLYLHSTATTTDCLDWHQHTSLSYYKIRKP
ncbi:hypothetical protein J6590_075599, partial [Homalodisca vitripennis]